MKIKDLTHKPASLKYGIVNSPVGDCTIAWCNEGLCALYVATGERAESELKRIWGENITETTVDFDPFADNVTLAIYGTPFQKQVWRALVEIPAGTTLSYSELATKAGLSKAIRAVASAVARNEISLLIPCHRIVRKGGEIGQYRWGAEIKRRLIEDSLLTLPRSNP